MTIFVLVRDKKQDYCVHKKRHISFERRRDRICKKKIKIICENGSLTDGVKKQRMLEKKTRPVLKYTVQNCRINLKKIKNVHFFDRKSGFDAETEDSDSSYEPAESEGSIENEEYLVANVSEDENSDIENTGSGNVDECNNVSQNTSTSTLNCSFNVNGHTGWDDSDVEAELTVKKGNLKKDTCCFCEKEYFKIARHLETVHKTEKEVQDFMKLEECRQNGSNSFIEKERKSYL
ncbi:Protein of unknown function, partial [Cotesia congregata]